MAPRHAGGRDRDGEVPARMGRMAIGYEDDRPMDSAQQDSLKDWLRRGGHNEPAVLAVTARRLIESGLLTAKPERNT